MNKLIGTIVATAFCFLAACGGGSPMDKMMSHTDKMLSILESNKADPAKAAEAISAYMKENEAGLKEAKATAEKYQEELEKKMKDDPSSAAKEVASMMEKAGPIMERVEKLQKEAPELMSNDKIQEAMRAMR